MLATLNPLSDTGRAPADVWGPARSGGAFLRTRVADLVIDRRGLAPHRGCITRRHRSFDGDSLTHVLPDA
jgi:hypothetical protein